MTHQQAIYSALFTYDPDTGDLRWAVSRINRIKVGIRAGTLKQNHIGKPYSRRYWQVRVGEKLIYVHRVAYVLMTGQEIPAGMQIDHRDGDGTNNRWGNLRLATPSQNMGNRGSNRSRRHDLPKGVHRHERDRLFVARLGRQSLGYFKTISAAKAAYDAAAADYFGEFARE
jgi:hypothetical protein